MATECPLPPRRTLRRGQPSGRGRPTTRLAQVRPQLRQLKSLLPPRPLQHLPPPPVEVAPLRLCCWTTMTTTRKRMWTWVAQVPRTAMRSQQCRHLPPSHPQRSPPSRRGAPPVATPRRPLRRLPHPTPPRRLPLARLPTPLPSSHNPPSPPARRRAWRKAAVRARRRTTHRLPLHLSARRLARCR